MPRDRSQAWKRVRTIGRFVFVLSFIVLTWVFSLYLVKRGVAPQSNPADQASTLFGAAQVSLFILSIHIGIVTVLGWQFIEGMIRRAVEEVTNKRLEALENEARGRSLAVLGYVIGENSVKADFSGPNDLERQDTAAGPLTRLVLAEQGGFGANLRRGTLPKLVAPCIAELYEDGQRIYFPGGLPETNRFSATDCWIEYGSGRFSFAGDPSPFRASPIRTVRFG